MMEYREFGSELIDRVKEIYETEHWVSYLKDDEKLVRAFHNSMYILGAFESNRLIGFVRCVGDGEHIVLVQDLIVDKAHQQRGIGTMLFEKVWDKYKHVRMFHVVTASEDAVPNKFYRSFGMKALDEGRMVSYFRV